MYADLQDKVVVVTGAGAGIGRAIAERFGTEGAVVMVNDLRDDAARLVAGHICAQGGRATAIPADATVSADVDRLIATVLAAYGRIDVLVNNVGSFEYGELSGSSEEDWDRCFATNVKATFLCSNRVVQEMKQAGSGTIVNISSGAGKIGGTWSKGYSAAKWAVLGLTKSLAAELAPTVRVNAVCPGIIGTDMDERFVERAASAKGTDPESYKRDRAAGIPLGRIGTPEDVASAVAFLASKEACYTTGEAVNVSGGLVMH